MGELVFIGLGLHDEKGITLRGLDEARSADVVFAELYTSGLAGATVASVEQLAGKKIRVLSRTDVEDRRTGLHSLVLLDLREGGSFLTPQDALALLLRMAVKMGTSDFGPETLACVLSRVGSPEVRATGAPMGMLSDRDLGPPLHCIVIPGRLHFLEKEALIAFAGAPHDL